MRRLLIATILIIVALSASLETSCSSTSKIADGGDYLVVTTTSVISSIVSDLAGDLVNVTYIVPPSLCPGHYDVKPSDVDLIRRADLILKHGIMGEYWLGELIESANRTGDLHVPVVAVGAGWNTPSSAKSLYQSVANALAEYLNIDVSSRLSECLSAIDNVDLELRSLAEEEGFIGTPVVVMRWQRPFVEYLGFNVVAMYNPPEKVSERDIVEIEENATKYGAKLVIDNLHSGVSLGERIANDVGAVHVVLINFPGVVPEANNLTSMMLYNAKLLADGLEEYEHRTTIQRLESKLRLWMSISIGLLLVVIFEAALLVVMARRREIGGRVE